MRNAGRFLILGMILCLFIGSITACKTEQGFGTADPKTDSENAISTTATTDPTPEEPKNTIDIYLVAGQSNAVGHTRVSDREDAYLYAPELENGYSNVLISGELRWSDVGNPQGFSRRPLYWQSTTLGLGKSNTSYFGPEAGMAKALSAYYNEESGRTAGIIKYGHGGTNLLNVTTGSSAYGNWVSPSYAAYLNVEYDGATGGLYREFLEVVVYQLKSLSKYGFDDFNIKGLYWMQGENDRTSPSAYETAFHYFAQDIRSDLSELVKEITGDHDGGASEMPIFIGTISETFDSATESSVAINRSFINMQKGLPNTRNNYIIVDNSKFAMNQTVEGTNKVLGSDNYHWNQMDHLMIGNNVGKAILKYYHYDE